MYRFSGFRRDGRLPSQACGQVDRPTRDASQCHDAGRKGSWEQPVPLAHRRQTRPTDPSHSARIQGRVGVDVNGRGRLGLSVDARHRGRRGEGRVGTSVRSDEESETGDGDREEFRQSLFCLAGKDGGRTGVRHRIRRFGFVPSYPVLKTNSLLSYLTKDEFFIIVFIIAE